MAGWFQDIEISCENGCIVMNWIWPENEAVDSLAVFYKLNGIEGTPGSRFMENVYQRPREAKGRAVRRLNGEQGLYTFTLFPQKANSMVGQPLVIPNIPLGNRMEIGWKFLAENQMYIEFSKCPIIIPPGCFSMQIRGFRHPVYKQISQGTRLLFPFGVDGKEFKMEFREPLDKLYHFVKQ